MTAPVGSVIEMIVLLNVLLMWPCPATFFFSCGAPSWRQPDGPSWEACVLSILRARLRGGGERVTREGQRHLPAFFLPATVRFWPLRVRALVLVRWPDREATTVTKTPVGTDLDLAADVGGDLTAEVTLDLEVLLDPVTQRDQVVVDEVLDAGVRVTPVAARAFGRSCDRHRRCRSGATSTRFAREVHAD